MVQLSYKDTTCGRRGGLVHGVGGCGSAFPLPAAVTDLVTLVDGWEEEPRDSGTELRVRRPWRALIGRVSSLS
jgi:hypothetical protein